MINIKKKNKVTIKKIIGMFIILSLISGVCVFATNVNTNLNNVKIICSNDYEITAPTSKTKVSEILEDNHIVVMPDEKVCPSLDKEITDSKTITISKKSEEEKVVEIAEKTTTLSEDEIKNAYTKIVEKDEVVQESIPFETITKDVSNSSEETTNKVIQEGREGLKEVTYRTKYQNDVQVGERKVISEVILQEPVNKIIQVKSKTTNRSDISRTAESGEVPTSGNSLAEKVAGRTPTVRTMNTSAYTASTCGKSASSSGYGITSSGARAKANYTLAAGSAYPVGTIIYIPYFQNSSNGGWFVVQDRGGAISNNRIDVYMDTYSECVNFGRRNLECYIYN